MSREPELHAQINLLSNVSTSVHKAPQLISLDPHMDARSGEVDFQGRCSVTAATDPVEKPVQICYIENYVFLL